MSFVKTKDDVARSFAAHSRPDGSRSAIDWVVNVAEQTRTLRRSCVPSLDSRCC
jgi:hypothetical protein